MLPDVNEILGESPSWEIHRALGVTQKTAWFMLHRLRVGTQAPQSKFKLGSNEGGAVEWMNPSSEGSRGTCTRRAGSNFSLCSILERFLQNSEETQRDVRRQSGRDLAVCEIDVEFLLFRKFSAETPGGGHDTKILELRRV